MYAQGTQGGPTWTHGPLWTDGPLWTHGPYGPMGPMDLGAQATQGGPRGPMGPMVKVSTNIGRNPQGGQAVDQTAPQEGQASFTTPAAHFFLCKCRSSCGLLGGPRWSWEALVAIYVGRMSA